MAKKITSFQESLQETITGIEKYIALMTNFHQTNVAKDRSFQTLFDDFYQVRRNEDWRKVFFSYLEKCKNDTIDLPIVLRYLYINAPKNRVELSFSSKLLHTVDPSYPIYDKKVSNYLKMKSPYDYYKWPAEKKLEYQIQTYQKICDWYKTSDEPIGLTERFDKLFPQYADKIGWIKKADFIIWRDIKEE